MKMMQGALPMAVLNRSRTRAAPTPTNISTNSEPEIEKKGTPASPATALASRVLPVPGAPTSSTPRGMRPPRSSNLWGFLRKSTTSISSSLASSMPATSAKVMLAAPLSATSLALLCPTFRIPAPPMFMRRMVKFQMAIMMMMGRIQEITCPKKVLACRPVNFTPFCSSWPTSWGSSTRMVLNSSVWLPWASTPRMSVGEITTSRTCPCSRAFLNSL